MLPLGTSPHGVRSHPDLEGSPNRSPRIFAAALTLVFGILLLELYPLCSSKTLAGWDTPGHLYLVTVMVDLLRGGRISGYDPNWFAGYPAFQLYPPLAYIVMGLPVVLSGGAIPPELSFNLFVLLLPCFFILATLYCSRSLFGSRGDLIALSLGLLWLHSYQPFDFQAVGLQGLLRVGLVPSYFALTLMTVHLGLLARVTRSPSWTRVLAFALVTTAIILSHILTALMVLLYGALALTCIPRAQAFRIAMGLGGGIALAAPWWSMFFQYLPFSSGTRVSAGSPADPLLLLFPELTIPRLYYCLSHFLEVQWFPLRIGAWEVSEFPIPQLLTSFPFYGVLLLAATFKAIPHQLREGRPLLVVLLLGALLLGPRDLFLNQILLGVHYYRLTQTITVVLLMVAVEGLLLLTAATVSNWTKLPILALLFMTLLQSTTISEGPQVKFLETYPGYGARMEILAHITQVHPKGRIAAESWPELTGQVGTLHFYSLLAPLRFRLPAFPGLLAESAPLTDLINSTLGQGGEHVVWGRQVLFSDPEFTSQPLESMLERLRSMGVEFLIASSQTYRSALRHLMPSRQFALFEERKEATVLRLHRPSPLIEQISTPPWFFVQEGGISFRTFCERWFKDPRLANIPVLWHPRGIAALPPEQRSQLAGVIVARDPRDNVGGADIERWKGLHQNIVVLNPPLSFAAGAPPGLAVLPQFWKHSLRLYEILTPHEVSPPHAGREIVGIQEPNALRFTAQGATVIRLAYVPGWRAYGDNASADPPQPFMVTPGYLFLFATGETELRFSTLGASMP